MSFIILKKIPLYSWLAENSSMNSNFCQRFYSESIETIIWFFSLSLLVIVDLWNHSWIGNLFDIWEIKFPSLTSCSLQVRFLIASLFWRTFLGIHFLFKNARHSWNCFQWCIVKTINYQKTFSVISLRNQQLLFYLEAGCFHGMWFQPIHSIFYIFLKCISLLNVSESLGNNKFALNIIRCMRNQI